MASANRNHLPNASDPWEGEAMYAIPSQGLNNLGNPIYSWRDAVKVMDADTGRNALNLAGTENFEWKMVGRSDDGMVYALAWSNKDWPSARWRPVDGRECAFWIFAGERVDSDLIGSAKVAGCPAETVSWNGSDSWRSGRCACWD